MAQRVQVVQFGGVHVHHLLTAREYLLELSTDGRRRVPARRLHALGELGQQGRVNGVTLGPLEADLGKMLRLRRVEYAHLHTRFVQRQGQRQPVVARRLHDHPRLLGRSQLLQLPDERQLSLGRLLNALLTRRSIL